ncbi:outer membrane beta-barrel family protein [Flavobacterium hydrophilum]|uniref:TonB-dependent receptor n=1 Tax=Flavobacterium hydrophilum TaxID=2211445 RepID=A0A2V4C7B7_9FLAO|nr:outer membrane beta-barrel family protein [Flavobacterium hydrophilum]PXY46542.1 TonB-dependent receptor [Flavobacterium hydrophilum]
MNSKIHLITFRRSLILITSIFFLNISNAQNASVKGIVTENDTSLPVEFASVSVLKKENSAIVKGDLTKNNGEFIITDLNIGNYVLKIISIGYETTEVNFVISNKTEKIILDTKMNLSNKLLNEVVIQGEKNNIRNKIDKQTYKANQFESAKGGNAVDVLKNLPSVAVDSNGDISVRGSSGFLVLINGKPVLTDAQTILSQIPANTIENIELITAPSAKYEADGKAGIVNITTKKGVTDGVSLQTNFLLGLPGTTDYNNLENPLRFGGDFTLNYKKEKWDLSVSSNYTRNDANGKREGDVYTKDFSNNTITKFPSNGERSFDRYNYGARTSISYTADKNNIFSFGFSASKKYQQRRADIVYNNSTEDLTTGEILNQLTYFNSNVQEKEGTFILGSFDYTHIFKNNSKIYSSAIYEYANLFGNTHNQNLDFPQKNNLFQEVNNPYTNPIKGFRFKLDYSTKIGEGVIETGYQIRNDNQDGKFDYIVNPITTPDEDEKFRGTAKSSNLINALYSQYSGEYSKLKYTAGLRYEYSEREVILSIDSEKHVQYLSKLFPSVNLLYTFNANWNAKAGYSKRIQRNNNYELNPIPEREHSETLEQGDPDLLPQFIDLIELGINHSFKKASFFSTLYYQNIKNPVQRVNSVYSETILNRLFTNADRARLIGLEIGTTYKPVNWFSTYIGTNLYNYKITSGSKIAELGTTGSNSDFVYSLNMNSTFDLGKDWILQANVNYLSAKPTAQGEDSSFLSPNTSVKKSFMNGKMTIGLQWQNMNLGFMSSNQQRITTSGPDFYTTTNYIYETDVFLLNFSYNLNKLNSKTKLPASELGEKEF